MLGLKSFRTAAVMIGGIELVEKIKKGRFKLGKRGGRTARMPLHRSQPCGQIAKAGPGCFRSR
jgi:hypothetical protein